MALEQYKHKFKYFTMTFKKLKRWLLS